MSKKTFSEPLTMIEEMAKQVPHLKIENVNSSILQQFSLASPYMIFFETCSEATNTYTTYQITPQNTSSTQFDQVQQQQLNSRPLHKHSFIEIMYVLSGSVTNRIENQLFTYTQGQCCIMNSNICHCEMFEGDFQVVFFMFHNDFLQTIYAEYQQELELNSEFIEEQPIFQLINDTLSSTHNFDKIYLDCLPVVPAEKVLNQLTPLINSIIFETLEKRAGFLLYIKGMFIRILNLLNLPSLYSVSKVHSEAKQQEYLTTKIIHILEANHGHCNRQHLTEQLHYSGEYLNRIFKRYIGKTISEYRQLIFLKESERLLLDTNKSISDIITELGFSNRSYFYRLFENNYGMSPMDYRKLHKNR